jgi:chromosome partitioning protein
MPVIVFSSSKGGCGKTTSSAILGPELALSGTSVAMLDADPNKNLMDWSKLPGAPAPQIVASERERGHMNTLSAIAAIAYLLAYGVAVYERIPLSDWLTSHLPL